MTSPPEDVRRRDLPPDLDHLLHDLRGPLNSAVMHLEVLKRAGVTDPLAKQSLETLGQELARLAGMLPAAFAVAALGRNETTVVALRSIVEQELRRPEAAGVSVIEGDWPHVRGDAELLSIAVFHLVRNALEATESEATESAGSGRQKPTVSVEMGDRQVMLVVRDWGPGMRNPRRAIRLAASQKPGRTGIGLVTVERIARLHGGTLTLAAPASGGVEARLTLPAA